MLKILLIEDHALVREGMTHLLHQLDEAVTVFEAATGEDGVAVLEANQDIDLVLLDLSLPGVDGLSWMKIQRKRFPTVPMLVVSAHDDGATIEKVMKAGAAGFVPKAQSAERLLDALNRVLAGEIIDPGASPTYPIGIDVPDNMDPAGGKTRPKDIGLTKRQIDVLDLLIKGKTNREIGVLLGLTEGTVKLHVTAVLKALGVKSRTQALVAATRRKIRHA